MLIEMQDLASLHCCKVILFVLKKIRTIDIFSAVLYSPSYPERHQFKQNNNHLAFGVVGHRAASSVGRATPF